MQRFAAPMAFSVWIVFGGCGNEKPSAPKESKPASTHQLVDAPDGAKGVDAYDPIDPAQAREIHEKGYAFAVRYVRHADSTLFHLTKEEADGILDAGLGLMLVQEGRGFETTVPSSALGSADGKAGVEHATSLDYPKDGLLWLDVESVVAPGASANDVIAYATAWYDVVSKAFVPGYYVGPAGKLSAEELGALPFEHFWKSGTEVPTPSGRGYQMIQHPPETLASVNVDIDTTQADERGGRVRWLEHR